MRLFESTKNNRYTWEWAIGLGVLLMILGIVAVAAPFSASVSLAWLLGAVMFASGIAQLVHAIRFAGAPGRVGNFLFAALSLIAGILIFRNPIMGAVGVTAVIAFYLLIGGVTKAMLASDIYPLKGWGTLVLSSLLSIGLGTILLVTFPTTSLFVPGLFFGVDLLFVGASSISFAFALRKMEGKLSVVEEHRRKAG